MARFQGGDRVLMPEFRDGDRVVTEERGEVVNDDGCGTLLVMVDHRFRQGEEDDLHREVPYANVRKVIPCSMCGKDRWVQVRHDRGQVRQLEDDWSCRCGE